MQEKTSMLTWHTRVLDLVDGHSTPLAYPPPPAISLRSMHLARAYMDTCAVFSAAAEMVASGTSPAGMASSDQDRAWQPLVRPEWLEGQWRRLHPGLIE